MTRKDPLETAKAILEGKSSMDEGKHTREGMHDQEQAEMVAMKEAMHKEMAHAGASEDEIAEMMKKMEAMSYKEMKELMHKEGIKYEMSHMDEESSEDLEVYSEDAEDLEEGLKDWAKKPAMAGVIVAGLAGVGSIQDAIDRSVPAVQAMETALEMAQDQGNDELADMIKNDLSAVKVRLSSGKDLNFVKDMQDKYSKFVKTEGLAYESRLAIMLNQQLK